MKDILSYYYFTGETIEGDYLEFETRNAMTDAEAEAFAHEKLLEVDGGHLDAFYSETDEFAFDVEV